MRPTPQIFTGVRPTRADRVTPVEKSEPGLYARISALLRGKNIIVDKAEKTPYDILWAAKYGNHMVQVTSPEDERDPRTGRKRDGRPVKVQFRNGLYSIPRKHDLKTATDIVEWLRGHPNYKIDFWEQQEMVNEGRILKAVKTIEMMSGDPAVRETVLEFMTRQDFVEDQTEPVAMEGAGSTTLGEEDEIPEGVVDETGDERGLTLKGKPKKKPGPKAGRKKKS